MANAVFREDDDPPLHGLRSAVPDLLRGWDDAGPRLTAILENAESRAKFHPDTLFGTSNRFGDVRMHIQVRQTYANPHEKARIVKAATRILDETVFDKEPTQQEPFYEALSALRREEERVFVAVLLGATRDLVYWNWRYGYTLIGRPIAYADERAVFDGDIGRWRVAAPELARARHGKLVTDVSPSNEW